jgi:antitoxin (DNA-binding transcriptional repressor) of toxin-antitoxin stability system
MKSVGIKNLKNNLSRYLKMVRESEVIYVTDRDNVVAEIHKPLDPPALSRWQSFLQERSAKEP